MNAIKVGTLVRVVRKSDPVSCPMVKDRRWVFEMDRWNGLELPVSKVAACGCLVVEQLPGDYLIVHPDWLEVVS